MIHITTIASPEDLKKIMKARKKRNVEGFISFLENARKKELKQIELKNEN